MPRLTVLALCLFAPWVQAQDDSRDMAYSLGARLGEQLREEAPELQLQAVLDGVRHAYSGEPLQIDARQMSRLLAEHQAHLAAASQDVERAIAAEQRFLAGEKTKPGVRTLKHGILLQELRAGKGAKPNPKGRVQVRYMGFLADGRQFDESQTPQWHRLDSVIPGWQSAVAQMPVGAQWRLVIPSAQAYGAQGAGDLIPPYAPLVFELELLDTKD